MTRALVLSGGGAKGAYQVGVLKHLLGNLCTKYDALCGISVGAINAGYLAMFKHGEEKHSAKLLEKIWRNLKTRDIYVSWVDAAKPLSYLGYIKALWKQSAYNSKPLAKLIADKFDADRIINSGKDLHVGAVSINTGEYRIFDQACGCMIDAILASSSFPVAFCPIEIDGQMWTDGGVRETTPLKCAISLGADDIDVIITSPKRSSFKEFTNPSLIQLAPRFVEIMSEKIIATDLDRALDINKLIKCGADVHNKRYINIRIFRPDDELAESSLEASLEFEQKIIGPMIERGYADAQKITGA